MGRMIDADALLSEMGKYSDDTARSKNEYLFGMQQRLETCIELVEDAPTVDAVDVVRCRDCKWWDISPACTAAPAYHECKARASRLGRVHTTA